MIKDEISNNSVKIKFEQNRPGDVLRLFADSKTFNKHTNWKADLSFDNGLCKTIDWFNMFYKNSNNYLDEETGLNWQ